MNEIIKNCLHCGSNMQTQRSTKKYCSDNCKQAAFQNRTIHSLPLEDDEQSIDNSENDIENTISEPEHNGSSENEIETDILSPDLPVFNVKPNVKTEDILNVKEVRKQPFTVPATTTKSYTTVQDSNDDDSDMDNEENELPLKTNRLKKSIVKTEYENDYNPYPISERKVAKQSKRPNERHEREEDPYEFIHSTLVEAIEDYLEEHEQDTLMFENPRRYWNSTEMAGVKWVSLRFRSIVETMLYLNHFRTLEGNHIVMVRDALKAILNSVYFKLLPYDYPFTKHIRDMNQKLQKTTKELTGDEDEISFRPIAFKKKVRLIAIRFQLAKYVPKVKFSTTNFNK